MGVEFWFLNHHPEWSGLNYLKAIYPDFAEFNTSTEAGKPISYWLGWIGFAVMLLTNIYILRKRVGFMQSWGRTRNWLDFHIFCGLLGPTCIVFHSNFNVRGLVAISFWSMMIVAISGVLGRYFYVQIIAEKAALKAETERWGKAIQRMLRKSNKQLSENAVERMKLAALDFVGAIGGGKSVDFLTIIFRSLAGDVRLMFSNPPVASGLHRSAGPILSGYALSVRRENYLEPYTKLLGYWHTFHVPFTIVMYITAVIHIAAALLFKVT